MARLRHVYLFRKNTCARLPNLTRPFLTLLLLCVKYLRVQVDNPAIDDFCSWCHPIDIHYAITGLQGWPAFQLTVYNQDNYGRDELFGYGLVHVPSSPGWLHMPT